MLLGETTKIKPGNSKTLWDSVKIVSDKEVNNIPEQMVLNNETIEKDEIPETFANYFQEKINNLAQTCNIDQNVSNITKFQMTNKRNSHPSPFDTCALLKVI